MILSAIDAAQYTPKLLSIVEDESAFVHARSRTVMLFRCALLMSSCRWAARGDDGHMVASFQYVLCLLFITRCTDSSMSSIFSPF